MTRINFVTNLSLEHVSGGWSGINLSLHNELSKRFEVAYVGPISPGSDYPAKIVSKINRLSGRQGTFHFFSQRRLHMIAKQFQIQRDAKAAFDFFHGQTPWIKCNTPRPYGAYVDACFSTYMDVFHDRSKFIAGDLEAICEAEAQWLERAEHVFFGSTWALDETVKTYDISRSNLSVVGIAGNVPVPVEDVYSGDMNFLFIALDFESKGGKVCCDAFAHVRSQYPAAQLTILGQRPPAEILAMPGVNYEGFLRKNVPLELKQFQEILSKAFALVHPTTMDTMGMVLIESAYHGCPSIAPRSFGIPELIVDGRTGFLVDTPLTAEAFAVCMLRLCSSNTEYLSMRRTARENAIANLTWPAVGERIASRMLKSLKN